MMKTGRQIIDDSYRIVFILGQLVRQVAADKSRPARNKNARHKEYSFSKTVYHIKN
jgi:hypothetical protein